MQASHLKLLINVEYNALHPISREPWYKQNTVHSYTPEEFKRRIVNMDSKQAGEIRVYDFLIHIEKEAISEKPLKMRYQLQNYYHFQIESGIKE